MPHRNESGKIITSKTPLLSNHSPKISSNTELVRVSNKMKNKQNNSTIVTSVPATKKTDQFATVAMLKSESQNGVDLPKAPVVEANKEEHSKVINGNSMQNIHIDEEEASAATGESRGHHGEPLSLSLNQAEVEAKPGEQVDDGAVSGENGGSPSLKNGFLHFHPQFKDQCDVPCRKDFINTLDSESEGVSRPKKIYRVVLTGGKFFKATIAFFVLAISFCCSSSQIATCDE